VSDRPLTAFNPRLNLALLLITSLLQQDLQEKGVRGGEERRNPPMRRGEKDADRA